MCLQGGSRAKFERPAWAGLGFHFRVTADKPPAPTGSVFVSVQRTWRQSKLPDSHALKCKSGSVRQGKRPGWAGLTNRIWCVVGLRVRCKKKADRNT